MRCFSKAHGSRLGRPRKQKRELNPTLFFVGAGCRNLYEPVEKEEADRVASSTCFSTSSVCDFVSLGGIASS